MQPEYRLAVGNLVQVYGNPAHTGQSDKAISTGEVHVVLDDGARYRVRILTSKGPYRVGELVDIDAVLLHQQGLRDETDTKLSGGDPQALFGDPRVTQYLGADDRLALSLVQKDESGRHASVQGSMAVTAEVLGEIIGNLERAEPPLRPDLGEVGTVSWMIIKGKPYTGVGGGGGAKDRPLTVRVFPDGPLSSLPVIDTPELDRQFELALRHRLAHLDQVADQYLGQQITKEKGEGYATALRAALARYADDLAALLGARPSPATASQADLLRDNNQIRASLLQHLRSASTRDSDLTYFVTYVCHKGATEKQMWQTVGRHVETLPQQAAIVDLVSSKFSKQGDGQFLLVASRRYAHLIRPTVIG